MNNLSLILQLIAGLEGQVIPLFIHNPNTSTKVTALSGIVLTTAEGINEIMVAAKLPMATPVAVPTTK